MKKVIVGLVIVILWSCMELEEVQYNVGLSSLKIEVIFIEKQNIRKAQNKLKEGISICEIPYTQK